MFFNYLTKDLSQKNLNQKIFLKGWIQKNRRLSSLCFLEFRNHGPILQIVVTDKQLLLFKLVQKLTKETVVKVTGIFSIRQNKNPKEHLGEYELKLTDLEVINKSETPPFLIQDQTDGLEKIRLEYRYLDLRRPHLQNSLRMRSKLMQSIRVFLHSQKFTEIETPILSTPTEEGAQNFLINFHSQVQKEFALPQSPQLYKQMLIAGGFESYFQIARCFRDEDSRQDRQPEFTQLDMEIAFASSDDVIQITEELIHSLKSFFPSTKIPQKFPVFDYYEALRRFGTDRPDLRYELELQDFSHLLETKNSELSLWGIVADHKLNDQEFVIFNNELEKKCLPPLKIFSHLRMVNLSLGLIESLKKEITNWKEKTIFLATGSILETQKLLGITRTIIAHIWKLTENKDHQFCWVKNGPLFTWSAQKNKYTFHHHPFTMPSDPQNLVTDWRKMSAIGYDLVINGEEIGSGSERIYNAELQKQIFILLGYTPAKIEKNFGFLLKAMSYGFPPSSGIGLGLDRLMMILQKTKNIRDVIAFPKTLNFNCLLTSSPKKKM